jgi:uncharacterized protein YqgV (UPF0045/DUF77 family)
MFTTIEGEWDECMAAKSGGRRNTFQVLGYEVIERLTRC